MSLCHRLDASLRPTRTGWSRQTARHRSCLPLEPSAPGQPALLQPKAVLDACLLRQPDLVEIVAAQITHGAAWKESRQGVGEVAAETLEPIQRCSS